VREREGVCVRERERKRGCVRERERGSVCVRGRARDREVRHIVDLELVEKARLLQPLWRVSVRERDRVREG